MGLFSMFVHISDSSFNRWIRQNHLDTLLDLESSLEPEGLLDSIFGDAYDRAKHCDQYTHEDFWPHKYRESRFPFAKLKVGQKTYVDIKYFEDAEEEMKKIRNFYNYWKKRLGVRFAISGRGTRMFAGVALSYEIRIERLK